MKKTIMALLLSAIFSAACFATVPYPLHESIGSAPANTSSTVFQFSDVWEYWSQGGSMYYVMRRWGCHAVAHTKLLVECGAASDDVSVFNPDVYFDWGVENGFYNRSDMLEQWGIYGPASDVVTYANANGVKLKKTGTVSLSGANSVADGNKVMQYINAGYYVIVTCKAHQAYVGREASVQAGKPILLDSWGSKSYYDGTCVEFVGYNLANFNELMYFEVEGELKSEIVPDIEEPEAEEPECEFNPEAPDAEGLPPTGNASETSIEIEEAAIPTSEKPVTDSVFGFQPDEELEYYSQKLARFDSYIAELDSIERDQIVMLINSDENVAYYYDSIELMGDTPPMIVDNYLCVPVRLFEKSIGAKVAWNDDDRILIVNYKGIAFCAWLGRTMFYLNGNQGDMPVKLFQVNDNVTYIPLRFMCEALSLLCDWDEDAHIAVIYHK